MRPPFGILKQYPRKLLINFNIFCNNNKQETTVCQEDLFEEKTIMISFTAFFKNLVYFYQFQKQ